MRKTPEFYLGDIRDFQIIKYTIVIEAGGRGQGAGGGKVVVKSRNLDNLFFAVP
jgi:hypothetical protein